MATLIPPLNSCKPRMTTGERRLAPRLEQFVKAKGIADKVGVINFHAWCVEQIKTCHVEKPATKAQQFFKGLVQAVIEGVESKQIPGGQYGAVLIGLSCFNKKEKPSKESVMNKKTMPVLAAVLAAFLLTGCGGGGGGGASSGGGGGGGSGSGSGSGSGDGSTPATWVKRAAGSTGRITGIAKSPSTFVAFTDDGELFTSSDGHAWQYQKSFMVTLATVNDVAWGQDEFVALTGFGTIHTSVDGITWTTRADCFCLDNLTDVAWSGTAYVTVGENGQIYSSPDGTTWALRTSPLGSADLYRVATSGSVFVATGYDSANLKGAILYSSDGATWTPATITNAPGWEFKEVIWDGSRFLATAHGNGTWSSTNGSSWTKLSDADVYEMAYTGSGYVAVYGAAGVATSPDAINWTPTYNFVTPFFTHLLWLPGTSELMLAGGEYGSEGGFIATSTDAATWQARLSGKDFTSVLWDGTRFVALSEEGRIHTSSDGLAWSSSVLVPTNSILRVWNDIAWNGTRYVVAASDRLIASTDGVTWGNAHDVGLTDFAAVTWTGAQFAALDDNGLLYASVDGIAWAAPADIIGSNPTTSLADIVRAGSAGTYVAVGAGGDIYASSNGTAWTAYIDAAPASLTSVAWTGALFVAVGDSGAIVTSPDGSTWTNRSISGGPSFKAVAYLNGSLVATGVSGRVFVSATGTNWAEETTGTTNMLRALAASPTRALAVGNYGYIVSRP